MPQAPAFITRNFLNGTTGPELLPATPFGPNGQVVYNRTYSRPLAGKPWNLTGETRAHEIWAETCRRVVNGNTDLAPDTLYPGEKEDLFNAMLNMHLIPGGRHLWADGTGFPYSRNCFAAPWGEQTSGHFRFLAARLFEGGGVGANYSNNLLQHTTPIVSTIGVTITCRADHPDITPVMAAANGAWVDQPAGEIFTVEDSREGWVEAWGWLIDQACTPDNDKHVTFDVSGIRPFGAELKTYGGTASGPEHLVLALTTFAQVLAGAVGRRLTSQDAMDLDHAIASAVVAGGTRRSARLAAKNWQDDDIEWFINCKENPSAYYTTNISVEIDSLFVQAVHNPGHELHGQAEKVLLAVATGMCRDGEPGFINSSLLSEGEPGTIRITNPCVTKDMWVETVDGPRQVKDLLGRAVALLVHGERWDSTGEGFFYTGHKPVLGVRVAGSVLKLTGDHRVMTPDGWVEAQHLKVGDTVVINHVENYQPITTDMEELSKGYLLGLLVGDGTFGKGQAILCDWGGEDSSLRDRVLQAVKHAKLNHRNDWAGWRKTVEPEKYILSLAELTKLAQQYGIVHGNKTLTPQVMSASESLRIGFLQGLYDADGHVEGTSTTSGVRVVLTQSDKELLSNVRIMLLGFGIRSTVKRGKLAALKQMPGGTYMCKDSFRLIVSTDAAKWNTAVGFTHETRNERLNTELNKMTRGTYHKPWVQKVEAITSEGTEDVYDISVPGINAFIAQGIMVHNCGEIGLETEGSSYGEACNIGSVNLDAVGTDIEYGKHLFRLLTRMLYRSTLDPYPTPDANHIEARNRRIGAGFMGLQEFGLHHGLPWTELANSGIIRDALTQFRQACRQAGDELADQLGLPRPVKVTAIAPNGTISKLPGVTPGIHPVLARYAEQRIRFSNTDPALPALAEKYPVEPCLYTPQTTVVVIPTRDIILDKGFDEDLVQQADEISAEQFFAVQHMVTETFCGGGDGNAVSATATIPAQYDPQHLAEVLRGVVGVLKGTTVFPDRARPQAPITRITRDQWQQLNPDTMGVGSLMDDCSTGACPVR